MNLLTKKILDLLAGKSYTQFFFEILYKVGLYGMNIGSPSNLSINGEINTLHYIKSKLKRPPVIFDVGANVGSYVEALLNSFETGEIHAFEPVNANFQKLTINYLNNPRLRLIQKGVGDQSGKHTIFLNPEVGSMASVYHRKLDHYNIEINATETIELITLEEYCKDNKIDHIDFLKLDIEGHELAALKGAGNLLKENKIQFIQFEFGGTNIDSKTYFQDFWYLLQPQYKIYRILRDGLREISSYSENNEIFGYTNYLAELR